MVNPIDFGDGYISEDWQSLSCDGSQTALIRHDGSAVGYIKLEFTPIKQMFLCRCEDDVVIAKVSGVQDAINYLRQED